MKIPEFKIEDIEEIISPFRDTVMTGNIQDYSFDQVKSWAPDEIDRPGALEKQHNNQRFTISLMKKQLT